MSSVAIIFAARESAVGTTVRQSRRAAVIPPIEACARSAEWSHKAMKMAVQTQQNGGSLVRLGPPGRFPRLPTWCHHRKEHAARIDLGHEVV